MLLSVLFIYFLSEFWREVPSQEMSGNIIQWNFLFISCNIAINYTLGMG